jgi:serine/threonine-protein kinase
VLLHQVRRVRSALEAEVTDDVELTQDLELRRVAFAGGGEDLLEADPDTAVTALAPAAAGYDAVGTAEAPYADLSPTPTAYDDTVYRPGPPEGYDPGYEATRTVTRDAAGIPTAPPSLVHDDGRSTQTRRRGRLMLVAVLVVALVAAGLGWWFGVARYDSAPDLTGMRLAQARAEGQRAGYDVEASGEAYSETVPRGSVVSTDPGPGGRILPEGTITLVVSKGKERYPMPDVEGMSEADAEQALAEVKAVVGEVDRRYSDSVEAGDVVSASIPVSHMIRPDTAVDLVVSKGRRPVKVADHTGEKVEEAQAALEDDGFEVNVERVHDDSVPADEVMKQEPPSGTAYEGDTITLTVSDGPEPIEVPGVIGKDVDEARAILEAAGFKVEVEKEAIHFGSNLVSRQSPGGGDEAQPGDTILLHIV